MGLFEILKKKKKKDEKGGRLDILPPPPISKPVSMPKPELFLPKEVPVPEIPQFKPRFDIPELPRFEPKRFEFKPVSFKPMPQSAFKPVDKTSNLEIPKFKEEIEKPKIEPLEKLEKSYISIEGFKDITEHINEIKKKIEESEEVLVRLNEIKNREDKEFEKWHSKFEDVQRKLVYIDKFLGG